MEYSYKFRIYPNAERIDYGVFLQIPHLSECGTGKLICNDLQSTG